ncbi:MAG: ATP-binding protein [Bdellovibrionota bacterium]
MASVEKHLQVWGVEGENFIFQDGSQGAAFELKGLNADSCSDEEINTLKSRIGNFLNSLKSGISLQFVFDVTSEYRTAREHEEISKKSEIVAARELSKERIGKVLGQIDSEEIPTYKLYLFLRQESQIKKLKIGGFFKRESRFCDLSETQYKLERAELETLAGTFESGLRSLGLSLKRLGEAQLLELLDEQWNPQTLKRFKSSEQHPDDLRASLCRSDVEISQTHFSIGNSMHRVVSLKTLPDHTVSGMSTVLKLMPIGSRTFVTIEVPDQISEIEHLKKDRRVAWAMARGKKTGAADLESEAKLTELEALLEEMISSGEKVFRFSMNTLLRAESEVKIKEITSEALSAYSEMNGAVAMEETFATFPTFTELSLPNARARERSRKIKTSNLSDFLPIFTPWEGMSSAKVLLKNAGTGALFKFDPFDISLANFNQLLSGGSGAGKSYFCNYQLLQCLSDNPYVYFVDIGGSYKKLTENLGGANIPIKLGSGLSINPFDLAVGERTPSDHKVKFLVGLVELMTKEEDVVRLPKLVRSELEIAIKEVFLKNEKPCLSHLKIQLEKHDDVELRKIAKILSSWCGDSAYGKFLDAPSNISLDTRLTAFDLKGLEQFQDLQVVALYIIIDLICRKIVEHASSKKFIVFDECWQLLKDEATINFIEKAFRAFRKENASAIAISQDIDDFAKSKISSAILPNCSVKWLLMQPQADGKRLKEILNFNDNEVEVVKSLSQSKGEYSEVFLVTKDNKAHLKIEATSLEYWVATTDPPDLNVIESTKREYPEYTLIEVLTFLAKKYPKGVLASKKAEALL